MWGTRCGGLGQTWATRHLLASMLAKQLHALYQESAAGEE